MIFFRFYAYVYIGCYLCLKLTNAEPCTTEDKSSAIFYYESTDEALTCAQMVAKDYCFCVKDSVRDSCCGSCAEHTDKLDSCVCRDKLGNENVINVRRVNSTEIIDVIDSCQKLASDYGSWCASYGGNGKDCCESCKAVDLTCVDDATKEFIKGGQHFNCRTWVEDDFCNCQEKSTRKTCCASCNSKSLKACRCRDTVDELDPAEVLDPNSGDILDSLHSCAALLDKYPQSCLNPAVFKNGGSCCKSCKDINKKCLDKVSDTLPIRLRNSSGDVLLTIESCDDLQNKPDGYPELCEEYGGKNGACCETCKSIDTSCLDTRMTVWRKGDQVFDCPGYIALNKCNCDKAGDKCCKTCKQFKAKELAECCEDNSNWRSDGPIVVKTGTCENCNCEEIRKKGKKFAKPVCKRNLNNTKENCCNMCRKVGIV